MMVRLLLGVALVANILVLVLCTETTKASSVSSSSVTSSSSFDSSEAVAPSKPKCHKGKKCPKNEEFSSCAQSIQRPQYCTEKDKPCSSFKSTSDKSPCKEACVCKKDFLRAENGTCIPEELCPLTCDVNEILDNCPSDCASDYCPTKEDSWAASCPTPEVCPPPKCKCGFNYRRAANGTCIPTRECPGVCLDNERYSECIQGECRALDFAQKDQSIACVRIDPQYCEKGCVCEEGYLRNQEGVCVEEDKCEPQSCISVNEEFVPCMQGVCRAKYCSEKGQDVPCPDIPTEQCDSGCICKENFLRAANGTCVREEDCEPTTCPVNEELSNCTQALCRAKDCYDRYLPMSCPNVPEESCEKGCVCKSGYFRDDNNVCIPSDQCPENPCPHNQRPTNCTQTKCVQKCFEEKLTEGCPVVAEEDCTEGCVCQEGYLQAEDGYCVPEDQCESTKCPPLEQWVFCKNAHCGPEYCYQKDLSLPCPGVSECIPGCLCQGGYLRNESGVCVPVAECKETQPTCGENEILEQCPPTCNTDYCPQSPDEEQKCTQSELCVPTCKCRFNYKRAENGTCIPTTECPAFDCSAKDNEVYVACPPYCPSDECGKPRLTGRCPFKIGVVLECKPKCQCKDGYGRVNGTCVPFAECPDLCPSKEVYSPCIQETCRPQNCSDRDVIMETCPKSDQESCQRGCVCQENYYQNEKGVCVSYEECGGPLCPNPHEVYTRNFLKCPPNICNSLVAKYKCDGNQVPEPACACESGYLRLNETSPCVPICECPEMASSSDCK